MTHPEPEPGGLSEAEARRVDFMWSAGMVGALGSLFVLLLLFRGVAVPVCLALAVAYVLNPLVTAATRRGVPRWLASVGAFGLLTLLFAAFLLYLVPAFRAEAGKLPDFFQQASAELVPKIERALGVSLPVLIHQRAAELGGQASDLLKSAGPALARLAAAAAGDTARFLALVLGLLVVPVLAFFFLRDYPSLVSRVRALIPRRAEPLVARRFAEVDSVLSAFVRGQLTVGAILAVLYATGLSVARIDLAILIGLITGFGNMVPYLGTSVGLGLSLLSLGISWDGPWQLGAVAATFAIAQALEGLVITPRVVGERVGLPPVAVIIAVLGFGEMFGFVGVLLAVPTSAILKVVLRVVIERYRRTHWFHGGEPA